MSSFFPSDKFNFQRSVLSLQVGLSIATALFVFGLSGLLVLYANKLGNTVRKNLEVQVFLERSLTSAELQQVEEEILGKNYVQTGQGALRFISREEAAQELIAQTGEDFINLIGENPLRDAFMIRIRPQLLQADFMPQVKKELETIPGVFEVSYIENLLQTINRNVRRLILVLSLFGIFILFTATVMIDNTVRIALFSQRFLIRSMQLIGATDGFIQKPYVWRAAQQGVGGGVFASLGVIAFVQFLLSQIEELSLLINWTELLFLSLILILMGLSITLISTYRSVQKYLKKAAQDIY